MRFKRESWLTGRFSVIQTNGVANLLRTTTQVYRAQQCLVYFIRLDGFDSDN